MGSDAQYDRPVSNAQIALWRREFPILSRQFHGKPLIYLDNAATTQKPRLVINALDFYYQSENANIHRGVYELSQIATSAYEQAREKIQKFVNAAYSSEIIYTRGTTESINLVAATYGRANLKAGDEVIISAMEHHSNIVPWQLICQQTGAVLRVIPMNDSGELLMDEYEKLLCERTKIVAVVHVSNSLGTVNPVKRIVELAHGRGAVVLIDGAQWVGHHKTDVRELDADFYAFSGHKLYGPTGIGVLYGKQKLLEAMPPYQGGGDMIRSVSFSGTTYADPPNKFEAGTPHIAGAIGLGVAIDFIRSIGFSAIAEQESALLNRATELLEKIPGVRIVGTAPGKAAVISFVIENPSMSVMDLGLQLDSHGIAVRTGHHCCQPAMERMSIAGTARASFAFYNTLEEVEAFAGALGQIVGATPRSAPAKKADASGLLKFPASTAASPNAAADGLAEDFELLGERDARNQYILDLGEKLLPMPEILKTPATRVHGCMSVVHLYGQAQPGDPDRLDFLADSDAHIVRGLIAILQRLFAGQRVQEILAFDVEGFFMRIGLDQFITTQRRNGLAGMVNRIHELARKLAEERVPLPVISNAAHTEPAAITATPAPVPAAGESNLPPTKKLLEGKVIAALQTVYDPEIPVNIYELGLIYGIDITDANYVKVKMTLTSPACPVAGSLPGEVEKKVESIPEVSGAEVELTWEPPWSKDRMSEAAMLQLGL